MTSLIILDLGIFIFIYKGENKLTNDKFLSQLNSHKLKYLHLRNFLSKTRIQQTNRLQKFNESKITIIILH